MSAGRTIVAAAGAAALLGAGYLARTWFGYGHPRRARVSDTLLDRFVPEYVVVERYAADIAAPVDDTFAAAVAMDFERSALVRGIFRGREAMMRAEHAPPPEGDSFVDKMRRIGWRVLVEEPGREMVFGAVTRPWEPNVTFVGLPPDEFRAFAEPGWVKIAWSLAAEARGDGASVFRTETRVAVTDDEARRRFRRYWLLVEPGIRLIRRESLRLVRADAERRARARVAADAAAATPREPELEPALAATGGVT